MRPTVRSRGTLPTSCGVVRVPMRYRSTAARCVLSTCAKGSVSWSGNGRGACRRSRWKTQIPISRLRAAQRYLENVSIARWNALRRVPRARFFSKCFESSRAKLGVGARLCVFSRVWHRPSNGSKSQDFRSRCTPIILPASRPITPLAPTEVDWSEQEFNALPPLVTIIKVADSAPDTTTNTLPVTLTASVNQLGLLQVSCVSADDRIRQSWPLEFDLRSQEQDSQTALRSAAVPSASVHAEPNVSADALEL